MFGWLFECLIACLFVLRVLFVVVCSFLFGSSFAIAVCLRAWLFG